MKLLTGTWHLSVFLSLSHCLFYVAYNVVGFCFALVSVFVAFLANTLKSFNFFFFCVKNVCSIFIFCVCAAQHSSRPAATVVGYNSDDG